MLSEHGQTIIFKLFEILRHLSMVGRCLSVIDSDMFVVDLDTHMPMLRLTALAYLADYTPVGGDAMISMMAGVIRSTLLRQGSAAAVRATIVCIAYICFHSSLVLVQNRMTLQVHMLASWFVYGAIKLGSSTLEAYTTRSHYKKYVDP